MIPKSYLSLHDVSSLRATVHRSPDTPLVLNVDSPHGAMQITIYIYDATAERMQAVADAINAALAQPEPPLAACPVEAAAYVAHDILYGAKP
jgi:hypothetical protein